MILITMVFHHPDFFGARPRLLVPLVQCFILVGVASALVVTDKPRFVEVSTDSLEDRVSIPTQRSS